MANSALEANAERTKINDEHRSFSSEFNQVNDEVVTQSGNFYQYLASISAGAIVASISFLGVAFQKLQKIDLNFFSFSFSNYWFLYCAWIFLLATLITALYKKQLATESKHYHYMGRWADLTARDALNMQDLQKWNLIQNPEAENWDELKKNIPLYQKAIKKNKLRFKLATTASLICGYIADVTFISGITCLVIFAIISLAGGSQ